MNTKQRQIMFVSLSVIIFGIFIWLIALYFTSASLTVITSDSTNQILINQQQSNHTTNPISVPESNGKASLRLSAGTYIITVQNNVESSSQVVTLGIGSHRTITLNPPATTSIGAVEPLSSYGAGSISASGDTLRFIDRNAAIHPLYTVSGGVVTNIDPSDNYQTIHWADPTFGISLATDKNNKYQIVKIENNDTTIVQLPFSASSTTGYGVAPNKSWYVSDGHTVYRGNGDGSFTNVYTSSDNVGIVSVSNTAVLLTQKQPNSVREGTLAILHTDGAKYQIPGEAYEAAWSPSGDKLVTSGDTSELFDSKFNRAGTLPASNFISPVWLDDNNLLYALGGNLWRYNTSTGSATIIAAIDSQTGIFSQITPSTSGDYIYTAIQRGGDQAVTTFALARIPLQNQTPANLPLDKLNLIIPNTVTNCTFNYLYFNSLTIVAKKPTPSTNCQPVLQNYLASYNLDLTNISLQQTQ